MNVDWRRKAASSIDTPTTLSPAPDMHSSHWAKQALSRVGQDELFARDLRYAFPDRMLPDDLKVLNIFHLPGRSLKVLSCFYNDNQQAAIVLTKFYSHADYSTEASEAKTFARDPANIGLLPEYSAIAYLFPEDPGLPNLANMLDLPTIGKILGQPDFIVSAASWKLMSYQEGKRCTLRYQFVSETEAYIGKIQNSNETTAKSHERLSQIWNNPARRFQMPRPIAYDSVLGARWETFCPGISMEEALGRSKLESLVRLITEQLINLHDFNIPGLSPVTPERILYRIERKILRRLHIMAPDSAVRAETLFKKLKRNIVWTENCPNVTLHGDFHIANFLLDGENLVFIDLDDLACGNPCFDLALFASRLLLRNLHHKDRLAETLQVTETLPKIYSDLNGRSIRPETFAWFMAAMLIGRQVKICMREDVPEMKMMIDQLLNWAQDYLDKAQTHRPAK